MQAHALPRPSPATGGACVAGWQGCCRPSHSRAHVHKTTWLSPFFTAGGLKLCFLPASSLCEQFFSLAFHRRLLAFSASCATVCSRPEGWQDVCCSLPTPPICGRGVSAAGALSPPVSSLLARQAAACTATMCLHWLMQRHKVVLDSSVTALCAHGASGFVHRLIERPWLQLSVMHAASVVRACR